MSNYPVWWDTSVTIYNKYTDPTTQTVTWYRSVVDNAFWKDVNDKVTIGDTILESNKIICRIREDANYKDKYLWIDLPCEDKARFFTLGQGDIIVKGKVADEVDESRQGYR